jgi:type III secretion system chaperone SycN
MNMDRDISELARRLGLGDLRFSDRGVLALDLEGAGRVFMERSGGTLLMYLAAEAPPHDPDLPRRLLDACHHRHAHPLDVSGGIHGGRVVLLTRLAEGDVSAAFLENSMTFLSGLMESVIGG